jgi:hypothetical protein
VRGRHDRFVIASMHRLAQRLRIAPRAAAGRESGQLV